MRSKLGPMRAAQKCVNDILKILHVYHYFESGHGYEENHLPAAQAALGADVTILTSDRQAHNWGRDNEDPAARHALGESSEGGIKIVRLPAWIFIKSPTQIALRGLKRWISDHRPDLLHLHGPTGVLALQTLRATRRLNIPSVVDCHVGYHNLMPMSSLQQNYYKVFKRFLLPRYAGHVASWIAITPDAESVLTQELGVPPQQIEHMVLGADLNEPPAGRTEILRSEHRIEQEAVVAVFAGRITAGKRVDRLLSALESELSNGGWYVVLAGRVDSDYAHVLFSHLSEAARRRVIVTGELDQNGLSDWLHASDIGVWPGEPGVTILQGMAAGLPLVLLDQVATRPYLSGNGYSFGGDVNELRDVLMRIGGDDRLRSSLGLASVERARSVFSWSVLAERSQEIYSAVIAGTKPDVPRLW